MRIFNVIILDASGSMQSIYQQALSGVNETIQTIRHGQEQHPEVRQYLTLASFANPDDLQVVYKAEPINFVKDLTEDDYRLRGCTALHDAMGDMITDTQKSAKHDDAVLVTIITDGYENASLRWSGPQIKSLVEELRQMGWTFAYIGADQDALAEAAKVGIHNSYSFASTAEETQAMFAKEKKSRSRFYSKLVSAFNKGESLYCCEDYFNEDVLDKD